MSDDPSGNQDGSAVRLALLAARFNEHVTSALLDGARVAVEKLGVKESETFWVPGAFELSVAALRLAQSGRFDAVVCMGAIIHHETNHDVYIANAAANGILRAGMDTGVPCIFCVLTCETDDQAMERAGGSQGNRGYDAVVTAVEMANLLRAI